MGKMKNAKKIKQPVIDNSRKAQRKQKRLQKKVHRQEHYSKKKTTQDLPKFNPGRFVKRPAEDRQHETVVKKKKAKLQPSAQEILSKERDKEIKEANKLKSEMDERRRDILVKANEDEDKLIKKLEKQLGLNKSKNKNNYFADDGLDYLLEICDRSTTEQIVAAEKHLAQVDGDSDFDEDLAAVTGKEITNKHRKRKRKDDDEENEIASENDETDEDNDAEGDDLGSDNSGTNDDEDLISDNESDMGGDEEFSNVESEVYDDDDDGHSEESEIEEKPKKSQKQTSNKSTDKKQDQSQTDTKLTPSKGKERIIKADELSKVFSDDEISHLSGDDDDDMEGFSGDEAGDYNDLSKQNEEKPDVWEDIYGRKRDKEGNIIKEEKGVYIPPHLRNKDSTSDKQLAQLKRQIKSVLNKLAGTNLHWACTSVESLYSNNSRNSVNTALTQLWLEATVGPSLTPDRLVAEHAALVSVLHANVGSEIGAHFLQELVKRFDSMTETSQPVEDKQLDNLVACLAHLYNFKIFDSPLIHDILNRLLSTLTEKNIDCALVAFRCCGATLRKHAPTQLKELVQIFSNSFSPYILDKARSTMAVLLEDIGKRLWDEVASEMEVPVADIMKKWSNLRDQFREKSIEDVLNQDVQSRASGISEGATSGSRIKFLLEVLMAIKNNNLMKIPNYEPTYQEHLKKITKSIVRKGNYLTPLNIRLEDLLKADERGKWWVVGSAWEGTRELPPTNDSARNVVPIHDQKLLELARKQRMNTDVRRSIFCVIMAAEDYMDAFEKLQHLGLKGQQEREVVHVLLACCLQEKNYNPYYSVLALKLCNTDRKYQLSIQFAVWDKIKDLENQSKQCLTNLAQFLIHLIMEKGLPISVLKVIQFSDLNKQSLRFMRQILLAIIMNENLPASLEVFHRISKPPKLHMFRESLRLFIQHFLVKNAGKRSSVLSEEDMTVLKQRAVEVDRILTMFESKLQF